MRVVVLAAAAIGAAICAGASPGASPAPSGSLAICTTTPRPGLLGCYRLDLPSRKLTRLTHSNDIALAWSHDGRRLAFARRGAGSFPRLYVVNRDGSHTQPVGRVAADSASWSPDDKQLVIGLPNGIALVRPDGTGFHLIRGSGSSPSWSPDGKSIAFVDALPYPIMVMNADGSGARAIVEPKSVAGVGLSHGLMPAWSPNGKQVAYFEENSADLQKLVVKVADADGTGQRKVGTISLRPNTPPSWAPDSHSVAVADERGSRFAVYLIPTAGGSARLLYGGKDFGPVWDDPAWAPRR